MAGPALFFIIIISFFLLVWERIYDYIFFIWFLSTIGLCALVEGAYHSIRLWAESPPSQSGGFLLLLLLLDMPAFGIYIFFCVTWGRTDNQEEVEGGEKATPDQRGGKKARRWGSDAIFLCQPIIVLYLSLSFFLFSYTATPILFFRFHNKHRIDQSVRSVDWRRPIWTSHKKWYWHHQHKNQKNYEMRSLFS